MAFEPEYGETLATDEECGGHCETTLMPDPYRKKWTEFTNKSAVYMTSAAVR